jgi:hypothetical protein
VQSVEVTTAFTTGSPARKVLRNKAVTKLSILKVSNEEDIAMKWLIDALNDLKENFLRIIIYCNSITNGMLSSPLKTTMHVENKQSSKSNLMDANCFCNCLNILA